MQELQGNQVDEPLHETRFSRLTSRKLGREMRGVKSEARKDLPIEAIIVLAEMKPELVTYILHRIMSNIDSWKL